LPIAAVTAWSTLAEADVRPGHVVVAQGTGGVSLFAVQFAWLAGARVIILSSSNEKLARARQLGAEVGINYRTTPDWHVVVKEVTQGRGADIILETVGNTLHKSLAAVAFGGFIGIVGFVGGYEATLPIRQVIGPMVRMQGIAVGSRARFDAMNRAIAQHQLHPVIDRTFPLEQAAEAFKVMQAGQHFGKLVITL